MKNPYLIQRLEKPFANQDPKFSDNPFAFGGGVKNGGLSDEAYNLLKGIWRYDYMGSAEFEFGALPKSLQAITKNIKKYVTGQLEVVGKFHCYKAGKVIEDKATVYYFCNEEDEAYVREWIPKFADGVKNTYSTKEHIGLAESICKDEYYTDKVGWHDIENHYLFFTEKEMFNKFCRLMGVK